MTYMYNFANAPYPRSGTSGTTELSYQARQPLGNHGSGSLCAFDGLINGNDTKAVYASITSEICQRPMVVGAPRSRVQLPLRRLPSWTDRKWPSAPSLVLPRTSRHADCVLSLPSLLVDLHVLSRRRRLGDKTLPQSLTGNPTFAADSKMYQDLLDMERRLDWQMMRKKAEIQDTIGRPLTVSVSVEPHGRHAKNGIDAYGQTVRTLRLFLSHTVSGQAWQTGGPSSFEGAGVNLETGEGIPAWQLKLEGRLLEVRCLHVTPRRRLGS
jgi:hypothetical protein